MKMYNLEDWKINKQTKKKSQQNMMTTTTTKKKTLKYNEIPSFSQFLSHELA